MGWSLIDFTADLTGRTSEPSSTPALLLILSKQKIFRYFMHMRAKTICGFALATKSFDRSNDFVVLLSHLRSLICGRCECRTWVGNLESTEKSCGGEHTSSSNKAAKPRHDAAAAELTGMTLKARSSGASGNGGREKVGCCHCRF